MRMLEGVRPEMPVLATCTCLQGLRSGAGAQGSGLAPHCPLRSGVGSGERGGLEFEPAGHRDLARRSPRRCCGRSRPHR